MLYCLLLFSLRLGHDSNTLREGTELAFIICIAKLAFASLLNHNTLRHAGCSLARYNQCQGGPGEGAERDTLLHVLAAQAAMCQELLDIEPAAKWPLLTLTRLRELQAQLQRQAGGEARATEGEVEVQEGYTTLAAVDKLREGYYQDAAAGKAHVVTMPQAGGGDNAPAV